MDNNIQINNILFIKSLHVSCIEVPLLLNKKNLRLLISLFLPGARIDLTHAYLDLDAASFFKKKCYKFSRAPEG